MPVPRVSVLLPVFDADATLDACLRSLRRQTFSDWECLLVDDGSRDGSLALARRVARDDLRIRVIERAHEGLVPALNAGLEQCRAALVARMDADDAMHRRRLEIQVRTLEEDPKLAATGCHVRLFPRAELGAGMRAYERWLSSIDSPQRVREEAFVECPLPHPSLVARTSVLRDLRYRDRGWPEDYDLLLRMLSAGHEVGVVPRRLLHWRHGPARLSQTHASYAIERFTECKAEHLAAGFLAERARYVLWGYGATGRTLANALEAHGKRVAAIVELHPGRLGNRIREAPVIAPERLREWREHPLLVSVAGAEARGRIRATLRAQGFTETRDYVVAA